MRIDKIADQEWLLETLKVPFVVHPSRQIPVTLPKIFRVLLMMLSSGHYLTVNWDNVSNTTELSQQYLRLITYALQFHCP